ncbi:hypothetical protein DHD05_21215 [Arenibacter sp. N53]|nr:hypothetical protein [Arenibacter sp. N53]
MGTDKRLIRSYLLCKKCWGSIGIFIFLWVGRGKGKRLFLPFVLLSGSEGVKKPETERPWMRIGGSCPLGWFWSCVFFNFRRGKGKTIRYLDFK